jgi:hypothetical protein
MRRFWALVGLLAVTAPGVWAQQVQTIEDFHVGAADGRPLGWDVFGLGASGKAVWLPDKPGAMRCEYKFDAADGRLLLLRRARLRLLPDSLELTVKGKGEQVAALIRNEVTDDLYEYRATTPLAAEWSTLKIDLRTPTARTGTAKIDTLPGGAGLSFEGLVLRADAGAAGQVEFRDIVANCQAKEDQSVMLDFVVSRPDRLLSAGDATPVQAVVSTVSDSTGKPKVSLTAVDASGKSLAQAEQTVEVRPGQLTRIPLDLPNPLPCGHYTLRGSADDGRSKRAATLRFVVIPAAAEAGRHLGAEVRPLAGGAPADWCDAYQLALLKRAGAGWARLELRWADCEPTAGTRDFGLLDRFVRASAAADLPLAVSVVDPPPWMARRDPADGDELVSFMAEAAGHANGRVMAWEIWRQPNFNRYWPPAPQPYGLRVLLAAIAAKVKAVDPKALVINGGLRGWDPGFAGTLLGGDTSASDRLGLAAPLPRSPLPAPDTEATASKYLAEALPAVRQWWRDRGRPEIMAWVTNVGARTDPTDESKLPQAVELARCAAMVQGSGGSLTWCRALDGAERIDRYGLFRRDLQPKASVAAFAGAAAAAAGTARLGAARLPGGHAWLLKGPAGFVAVALADADTSLPALDPSIKVQDCWGNPVEAGAAQLGALPLYLTGAAVIKAFPMGS